MSVGRGLPTSVAQGFFDTLADGNPSFPDITRAASILTGVNQLQLHGCRRNAEAVRARWIIMCLAVHRRGMSYSRVAQLLGKDHTTIIHGSNGALKLITQDPAFAMRVMDVWNLACAGKAAMARAEMGDKAKRAEILAAAELAELRKNVTDVSGRSARGDEKESGTWTRTQLDEMNRIFTLTLTAYGSGMTYEVQR